MVAAGACAFFDVCGGNTRVRAALPTMAWEGLAVLPSGVVIAGDELRPGSPANAAVCMAFLKPGDKVLGLKLDHGGHLSHGHPVNFSGMLYNFVQYEVDKKTGKINPRFSLARCAIKR